MKHGICRRCLIGRPRQLNTWETLQRITITGYGQQDYPELKERYYQKLRQIQQEIAFLEGFLDQVEDSQTRDILRLYYVNGLTQEQIAEELGYARETISRKIRDFWQNSHK